MQLPAAAGEAISLYKSTKLFLLTLDYIRYTEKSSPTARTVFVLLVRCVFQKQNIQKSFLICLFQPKCEDRVEGKGVGKGENIKGKGR